VVDGEEDLVIAGAKALVVAGPEIGRPSEGAPVGNSACGRPGRSSQHEQAGRTMDKAR
jgi:hypothetical protein